MGRKQAKGRSPSEYVHAINFEIFPIRLTVHWAMTYIITFLNLKIFPLAKTV